MVDMSEIVSEIEDKKERDESRQAVQVFNDEREKLSNMARDLYYITSKAKREGKTFGNLETLRVYLRNIRRRQFGIMYSCEMLLDCIWTGSKVDGNDANMRSHWTSQIKDDINAISNDVGGVAKCMIDVRMQGIVDVGKYIPDLANGLHRLKSAHTTLVYAVGSGNIVEVDQTDGAEES